MPELKFGPTYPARPQAERLPPEREARGAPLGAVRRRALEQELQRELHDARIAGRGDRAEVGRAEDAGRRAKRRRDSAG